MFSTRQCSFFFFNDTATTEIYTLSLHDALPISHQHVVSVRAGEAGRGRRRGREVAVDRRDRLPAHEQQRGVDDVLRSEEHTSELQSRQYLVCRLLLEKKKNIPTNSIHSPHILNL